MVVLRLCVLHLQLLDPGGRRSSPQFNLFRELVIRAYLAVRGQLDALLPQLKTLLAMAHP